MKSLLDTCVLTELGKADGNPLVKAAVADIAAANLYLSVLTVGEIAKGRRSACRRSKEDLARHVARSGGKPVCRPGPRDRRRHGPALGRNHGPCPEVRDRHPERRRPVGGDRSSARSSCDDPQHAALRGERGTHHRPLANPLSERGKGDGEKWSGSTIQSK